MGEAKRRAQLDPNWGKSSLISDTFKICKRVFRPRTKEGETLLQLGIFDFYRTAFENDAPGVTMLNCEQGLAGIDSLPGRTGSPVFVGSRFIANNALLDVQIPKLPIKQIKHLVEETDFTSDRITLIRFCVDGDPSDLLAVIPVAAIQSDLSASNYVAP